MISAEKNEDLDICRECGGMCCIKCGCDYGVGDFIDRTYNSLLESLSMGDKSIVAMIDFKAIGNGKLVAEPVLYIRARNINRDIVDLVSMKTRCSQLGDNGCKYDYDSRPLGGRNLSPSRPENGPCRPVISPMYILDGWIPYQKQLRKIVKHYTGMSVERKIREDVENLFFDMMMKKFEGISPLELEDLQSFVPMLAKVFPSEFSNACEKYKKSKNNILSRK